MAPRTLQCENNYDHEVFNGDLGYVLDVDPVEKRVAVAFPPSLGGGAPHVVEYQGRMLDQIQLAWAITVHKAQGSEYPTTVIPLSAVQKPLLNRRIFYTALSRAKDLAIVVSTGPALRAAIADAGDERRQSHLRTKLEALLAGAAGGRTPEPERALGDGPLRSSDASEGMATLV